MITVWCLVACRVSSNRAGHLTTKLESESCGILEGIERRREYIPAWMDAHALDYVD